MIKTFANIPKIISLTKTLRKGIVGVTQKSYYDILGVPTNANPKQIRLQFLKKARQLHPDHNPQPQALQQFKQLKQAYQTLKDPQKRYIYDSGIGNEAINQSVYSGGVNWKQPGRKYYENKWYQYKKGKHSDQRDQYYQDKFNPFDQNAHRSKFLYRFLGVLVLASGYFGYDYMSHMKTKIDQEKQQAKKILEGPIEDKKTKKMRRYIQQRSKMNQVE